MLPKIDKTGLIINMVDNYYVNEKNSETLLLVDKIKEHLILLNPSSKNTYHYTQASFDELITNNSLRKVQYLLDSYASDRQLRLYRNIIGYTNIKTLLDGLQNLSVKKPGENVVYDRFILRNTHTGEVIYSGTSPDEMNKVVSTLVSDKRVFRPSSINDLNKLMLEVVSKQSNEPLKSLSPTRAR